MYCNKCGSEIKKGNNFCANCGAKVEEVKAEVITDDNNSNGKREASIILGILSLGSIFFVLVSPITLILGIIGLVLAIKAHRHSNNVIGIVLNSIGTFISLILVCIILLFSTILVRVIRSGFDIRDYYPRTQSAERY